MHTLPIRLTPGQDLRQAVEAWHASFVIAT